MSEWPADPGDRRVLAEAARTGRVLITAENITAAQHEEACLRAIATHAADLLAGAVVIVMPDRMRARAPRPDA